jgi:hypothetical protein
MPTAVSLFFAVERMERGVKGFTGDVHDNSVIVSNAQSVLSSRSYGDPDGHKGRHRRNQNVPQTRNRPGLPSGISRDREIAPDTESDILPDLEDASDC